MTTHSALVPDASPVSPTAARPAWRRWWAAAVVLALGLSSNDLSTEEKAQVKSLLADWKNVPCEWNAVYGDM